MKTVRLLAAALIVFAAAAAFGQSWSSAYEAGLKAARAQNWTEAREAFRQAAAYRPEDVAGPTTLPGPATEQRRWRGGAPYSPNFLAAYSAYRAAISTTDAQERAAHYATAASEFETLIEKGQASREAFYFLNTIYIQTGNTAKRQAIETKIASMGGVTPFKVDTEVVTPEELAQINSVPGGGAVPGTTPTIVVQPGQPVPTGTVPLLGTVAVNPLKFAIIIGNTESRVADGGISFAGDDAQRVREALMLSAGYPEQNIDLIQNGTSQQILASARAMAARIPDQATVMIYFTGVGANINGRDYLAGVEATSTTDLGAMVAKKDLYDLFLSKGSTLFAFYQANRPIVDGRYFGMEIPMLGRVGQAQATLPGEGIRGLIRNGKMTGIYTDAFVGVLNELKLNSIPVSEFGWQVFYRTRRGDTGTSGGGSVQTPTLPVLTGLAADARF